MVHAQVGPVVIDTVALSPSALSVSDVTLTVNAHEAGVGRGVCASSDGDVGP